jgi:peroxiredoxin Q/BCP
MTLTIGLPAPDFTLSDETGTTRRLADFRGQTIILYFYPKDDTPGCTTEACNFRDDWQQISAMDAQVVGISVDTSESHKAFAEKYHLPFPLLADVKAEAAVRYGAISDWKFFKFAKRYTFLIDPQGRIAKTYLSVNAERHSEEIIADLKQLKLAWR